MRMLSIVRTTKITSRGGTRPVHQTRDLESSRADRCAHFPVPTLRRLPLLADPDPQGTLSIRTEGKQFFDNMLGTQGSNQPNEHIVLFLRPGHCGCVVVMGVGKLNDLPVCQGQTLSAH